MNAHTPVITSARSSAYPTHQYARLTRFVPSLPGDLLCQLDRERNLNLVSQEKYDQLDAIDQRRVFTTETSIAFA